MNFAQLVARLHQLVWGAPLLVFLIATGWYYMWTLRCKPLKPDWVWKHTFGSLLRPKKQDGISPFQAMTAALGGTIGVGNISGVATALMLGGPGAMFWMWIAALGGMVTKYAEVVLAVRYRQRINNGWAGGPMYVLKAAGHPWLAALFAVLGIFASFGIGNMTQSNAIAGSLSATFGVPTFVSGIVLAALLGIVISGGAKRVVKVTEKIVPFMALLYIALAVGVLIVYWRLIPHAFGQIFSGAFDLRAAAGGTGGYIMTRAVRYGISRGVFTNEAGLGSASVAHAAADNTPVEQGAWGIAEVFLDTLVVCTLTALVLLVTGIMDHSNAAGAALSAAAFDMVYTGWGARVVSVSLTLFAFASMLSWCFYGERFLGFLWGSRPIPVYRGLYLLLAILGAVGGLQVIWDLSDVLNGLMALPNLIGLWLLRGEVRTLTFKRFQ